MAELLGSLRMMRFVEIAKGDTIAVSTRLTCLDLTD
jgi:hypothetical protein